MSLSPQKSGDYYARRAVRLGPVGSPDGPQSQREMLPEMLEHYFDLQSGRAAAAYQQTVSHSATHSAPKPVHVERSRDTGGARELSSLDTLETNGGRVAPPTISRRFNLKGEIL